MVPIQPASLDIWSSKYQLKTRTGEAVDHTMEDTWRRVAHALAHVEKTPELQTVWYEKFLWALQHGAIPAGRIISNAGANKYKPITSTINCVLSGNIHDNMFDILSKVTEAGMSLKVGSGIGYCFSTLRPKGAHVSGSGSETSGPLSFMDVYDKMCFTIASAGGRRGAQMGTMHVSHPNVVDFIKAKRENGRLRQFNLSLLITEEFMHAVENNIQWHLYFPISKSDELSQSLDFNNNPEIIFRPWPITDDYIVDSKGLVACKIYKTISAKWLWDLIMRSTYDYAEPGFLLIDRINNENNNWFCENIIASNPCFSGDTRILTKNGLFRIDSMIGQEHEVWDGNQWIIIDNFRETGKNQELIKITFNDGSSLNVTPNHTMILLSGKRIKANQLNIGDDLLSHNIEVDGNIKTQGAYIKGFLLGDGEVSDKNNPRLTIYNNKLCCSSRLIESVMEIPVGCVNTNAKTEVTVNIETAMRYSMTGLTVRKEQLLDWCKNYKDKGLPNECFSWDRKSKMDLIAGYFDSDGTTMDSRNGFRYQACSISKKLLLDIQELLKTCGIKSKIYLMRISGTMYDKNYDKYYSTQDCWRITISQQSSIKLSYMCTFSRLKSFIDRSVKNTQRVNNSCRVYKIENIGFFDSVYCCTVPTNHQIALGGTQITGQCGEQPLPPYGSCLLGSLNLVNFVRNPFTEMAHFDFVEYGRVIRIFTRMLDNVVEINGLALEKQVEEIIRKRRHGMGFLGLGSALTMLRIKYGSQKAIEFTAQVSKELAYHSWISGIQLAEEKGPAPIMNETVLIDEKLMAMRPEMIDDGIKIGDKVLAKVLFARYSNYMKKLREDMPYVVEQIEKKGSRFTHATSIAPTGTISLALANNVSNGIEPSFSHHYSRNLIRSGKKTKDRIDVYSYEFLAYKTLINPDATVDNLPDYFITSDDITPEQHVAMQAAAQPWIDSSISKTANIPVDYPFEDFKNIYIDAWKMGLKGCTTFRFNPEIFQGVLVRNDYLENTLYRFTLEDGNKITLKGNEEVEYDGEIHTAANLYDALKEGYYGKF